MGATSAEVQLTRAIEQVAATALALPDAYEEDAWVGVRWRVRQRTFAHVVPIDRATPPPPGPQSRPEPFAVLTFRSDGEELAILTRIGYPFYGLDWSATAVGMYLSGETDWAEVGELVTESYCLLAPKKLVDRVGRPPETGSAV